MKCIFCGSTKLRVANSRATKEDSEVWRRRECPECQKTFTTYESPSLEDFYVKKRTEQVQERFNRDKLFVSIYKACDNSLSDATALTDTVIKQLTESTNQQPIESTDIAQITFSTLERYKPTFAQRYQAYSEAI